MRNQLNMFGPSERRLSRRLMHMVDAGNNGPGPDLNAQFKCRRCGYLSEWMPTTLTDVRRGIPCPACSAVDGIDRSLAAIAEHGDHVDTLLEQIKTARFIR